MKKILILILIIGSQQLLCGQSWSKSNVLFGEGDITAIKSAIDSESNVIILGYFEGTLKAKSGEEVQSFGKRDYFIAKMDSDANVIWLKALGGVEQDYFGGGISVDQADNIYVTGGFREYLIYTPTDSIQSTGLDDIFMIKYEPNGNVVWCKNVGMGAKNQRSTSLEIDLSGNILLAGLYFDSIQFNDNTSLYQDNPYKDYYYSKYSLDGDLIWVKKASSLNSNFSGTINNMKSTADSYYFVGAFADSIGFENDTILAMGIEHYDIHLIKTDLNGNIGWIRKLGGDAHDYCYAIELDQNENAYIAGYYSSDTISIDLNATDKEIFTENRGNYDYLIAKYSSDGDLSWFKTAGGRGDDRLADATIIDNQLSVCGYFSDTLNWGARKLTTSNISDKDMFIGSIDFDGNFRGGNSYSGRNSSEEDTRAIFSDDTNTYNVIRSNSDILVLGDSIYSSSGSYFYIAVGVVSCLPITIDNAIATDVSACFGDSTGSIQVTASGGFGAPWEYSIDNGITSQVDLTLFSDLPAGEYPVVVFDSEGCDMTGPVLTINQPEELLINVLSTADVTPKTEGHIEVEASGGTAPYTYTLQPNGTLQGFGTFGISDTGSYVVEVNDAKGCGPVSTDTIIILDGCLPISIEGVNTIGTCNGLSTGSIQILASGGLGEPWQYSIDSGVTFQAESIFADLPAGDYQIVVADLENCLATGPDTTILEADPLSIEIDSTSDIPADGPGQIVVKASGGTSPYTYTLIPDSVEQVDDGSFDILTSGTYTVEVKDDWKCGPVTTGEIIILGITNYQYAEASIYPNPSKGEITIEMSTKASQNTLEVMSMTGQVLISTMVYPSGGQLRETLHLGDLAKGMYMLRVDGKMLRSAIVLQ